VGCSQERLDGFWSNANAMRILPYPATENDRTRFEASGENRWSKRPCCTYCAQYPGATGDLSRDGDWSS
jgi:hypothetical protein